MATIHFLDVEKNLTDSIASDCEDCFTLDSFASQAQLHIDAAKHYLIARVQTVDLKQPDKVYRFNQVFYSYYDATQINKLLFQTQRSGERRLLHRLYVLNPLTNTDIIGDVEYFSIKEAVKELPLTSPVFQTAIRQASSPTSWVTGHEIVTASELPLETMTDVKLLDTKFEGNQTETKHPKNPKLSVRIQHDKAILDQSVRSPLKIRQVTRFSEPCVVDKLEANESARTLSLQNAIEQGRLSEFQDWVSHVYKLQHRDLNPERLQFWNAHYVGTDDDFLRQSTFRKYFRDNTTNPDDSRLLQMADAIEESDDEITDTINPSATRPPRCYVM